MDSVHSGPLGSALGDFAFHGSAVLWRLIPMEWFLQWAVVVAEQHRLTSPPAGEPLDSRISNTCPCTEDALIPTDTSGAGGEVWVLTLLMPLPATPRKDLDPTKPGKKDLPMIR